MKLNSHVIFLIAIVGIIAAGVVGATLLSNGSMKQVDFDGIKVSVPADSNFVKTADGYADSKYGITINTFNSKDSMVNYLKSISGASVIPLKNQPPQSVAFVQGDDTKVFVANGGEAIAIGAKDQGLVSDMANTVVFSNHQKSAKPNPIIPVILPPPYLDMGDFNQINNLTNEVNNDVFNNVTVYKGINESVCKHNDDVKNNALQQNTAPDNAVANDNQQNTSLLDNNDVSNIVNSISSDNNPSNGNSAGGDSGAVASSSGSSGGGNSPAASIAPDANANSNPSSSISSSSGNSAPSSVSSASSSANSAPADNNQQQKINQKDLKEAIERGLPSGYSISKIEDSGSSYLVFIKDSHGKINKYAYSYDGNKMS